MEFQQQRFRALVLYIADLTRDDPKFGRTKLAKTLFYSDFAVYQDTGEPLTGATYLRKEWGPFPQQLKETEEALEVRGLVELIRPVEEFEENRILPLFDTYDATWKTLFEDWHLILVRERLRQVAATGTAKQVADVSHEHPGWRMAAPDTVIPYEASVLPTERPTPAQTRRAKEIARERGWLSDGGQWLWERERA